MAYRVVNAETYLVAVANKKRRLAKKIRNGLEAETGQKHRLQKEVRKSK